MMMIIDDYHLLLTINDNRIKSKIRKSIQTRLNTWSKEKAFRTI
jgi:hypothetical protein